MVYNNKKEEQLRRLRSIVPESAPNILSLNVIYSLKRKQEKIFNEVLANEINLLKYNVLSLLQDRIYKNDPEDLKRLCGIYFTNEKGEQKEILPFILESSFNINMDADGQLYVLAGNGFTPCIKMEDILRRGVSGSIPEVKSFIEKINDYLDEMIEINFIEGDSADEFRIGWDISSLIENKALSV